MTKTHTKRVLAANTQQLDTAKNFIQYLYN